MKDAGSIHKCRVCGAGLHRPGTRGPWAVVCTNADCISASRKRDWQSEPRPCMVCGIGFIRGDRGVASWTCSDECRHLRSTERNSLRSLKRKARAWEQSGGDPRRKSCVVCGVEFGGVAAPLHDRCGQCRLAAKTHTCARCGNEFVRGKSPKDASKYCSHQCYIQSILVAAKPRPEVTEQFCRVCGKPISPSSPARYCSRDCRLAKQRIEHKRQLAQRRWSCGRCGRTWLGHKATFCAECRIIDSQENKRASRARRKAIKRGATSETFGRKITLERLIERDGIRCAICGRNTDADAHHLSDAYPSVDHIVPSSHGGAHSWTNVRVAHRGCNSRRQNNPSGAIQTALPMIIEIRGAFGTIIMTPVATENRKK